MKTRILVLFAAVLAAACAVSPAAASEFGHERFELGDPLLLSGHGRLHGSVKAPGLRVLFRARQGVLRVVDISGDSEVMCRGYGRKHVRTNDEGQEVTVCAGSGAATVTGGEFRFAFGAKRLQAFFPARAQGVVTAFGRFIARGDEPDAESGSRPERPVRPVRSGDEAERVEVELPAEEEEFEVQIEGSSSD
jgi:hypothetical protein